MAECPFPDGRLGWPLVPKKALNIGNGEGEVNAVGVYGPAGKAAAHMTDSATMGDESDQKPARRQRVPRPATPERLEKAALHYLERYASSRANLQRVLMRRVERSARLHDTDREEAHGWVEAIVARLAERGLLDDALYAESRAVSLHRGGGSRRKIALSLRQKGVESAEIDAALEKAGEEYADGEFAAAFLYARRRRLGPFRVEREREARRDKDIAAMARAGFGLDLARRIVEAAALDDLEAEALAPA